MIRESEGDGAGRAGVIGLIQQAALSVGLEGWRQTSLVVLGSVQIKGS